MTGTTPRRGPKLRNGRDLRAHFQEAVASKHPRVEDCPECGKSVQRVGIVYLVYTFEVCACDLAPYKHLIETLHHRICFQSSAASPPSAAEPVK